MTVFCYKPSALGRLGLFMLTVIVCLFLVFTVPAHAVEPVTTISAFVLGSLMLGLTAAGIEVVVEGLNPGEISRSQFQELWQSVFNAYFVPMPAQVAATWFPESGITYDSNGAVSFSPTFTEHFNHFVNWLQTSMGLNSTGSKILLSTLEVSGEAFDPIPILDYRPTHQQNKLLGQALFTGSTSVPYPSLYASADNSVYVFAYDKGNDVNSPNLGFYAVTPFYGTSAYFSSGNTSVSPDNTLVAISTLTADLSNKGFDTNIGYYIVALSTLQYQYYNNSDFALSVPFYASENAGFQAAIELFEGNIEDGNTFGLALAPGVIRLPEVDADDVIGIYAPGIAGYGDNTSVGNAIIDASIANELEASYAVDTVLDSQLPIPVVPDPHFFSFDLPDFDFDFIGIWHYVVDWVASLGSWLSMMFTVWSCLPSAMVIPVYASAVVVIVLGMYKRFFV